MRTYPSKRDGWLLAVIGVAGLVALSGVATIFNAPTPIGLKAVFTVIILGSAGLVGWLLVATGYEVSNTTLTVRSGPFTWVVALDDIEEIYPSRNPLSSPALSLDRIAIRSRGSRLPLLISPADREEFLVDLARRSPGLVKDGSRYRRVGE
ncbi:MAG: PH domain-containing protein [Rhodothermales bacterium]|nr:PH domain-containing protein [Rhodothermales bacterium]